jgi:hypothetical protein
MKKVGILCDNISGNVGDQAIGISVRKMLARVRWSSQAGKRSVLLNL